jgi:hypothetical protein
MKNLLFFAGSCALILSSCSKEEADSYQAAELQLDYFPLSIGKYAVYEVDSTIYDPNGAEMVYHTRTYFKEEVADTLTGPLGETIYRIERYERTADSLPWTISRVLSASIEGNRAIVTEDNLRFISLVFPPRENSRWNGLAFIDPEQVVQVAGESLLMFKGWDYSIPEPASSDSIGSLFFPEVLTVQEAEDENLIELRRSFSQYARGTGLVYRERWILDTQCISACDGQSWEEKAEKGFIVRQRIIEYK